MNKVLIALTLLGVFVVLSTTTYFPTSVIYEVTFEQMWRMVNTPESIRAVQAEYNPDCVRLRITLFSFGVAAVIILAMYGLRKACSKLELRLFERILLWGMYYLSIATFVMILGMWLDFRLGRYLDEDWEADYNRLGFFFYQYYFH